jgi:hypothetical protein
VRRLDEAELRPLPGTDGAGYPFWSRDGRYIGFGAQQKLKVVDTLTGEIEVLADASAFRGGEWLPDGRIVFSAVERGALETVAADGGTPAPFTTLDAERGEIAHRLPQMLPDGKHLLYRVQSFDERVTGTYVREISGGAPRRLVGGDSIARYVAPGYLMYVLDGALLAQRFDAARLVTSGDPVTVARDVISNPVTANAWFSASACSSGRIVRDDRSGRSNHPAVFRMRRAWTSRPTADASSSGIAGWGTTMAPRTSGRSSSVVRSLSA